jgi:hypothetical protein
MRLPVDAIGFRAGVGGGLGQRGQTTGTVQQMARPMTAQVCANIVNFS